MRYKQFGSTGLEVSLLSVGTWAIGGSGWGMVRDDESIEAIRVMINQGVNLIDTAPTYGRGHSEEIVGKALKGHRQEVYLLTKCGIRWEGGVNYTNSKPIRDSSRQSIMKQCDESLKRLNTDYIDFYLIHWPDVNTLFEETVDALKELKQQGKIRFTGISNFEEDELSAIHDLGVLDVIQYPYSMVNRTKEALLKTYREKGVAAMGYGSLGAGILTGSIRELPQFEEGDARKGFYDFFEEPRFSQVMKLLETLDEIALARGVPVSQVTVNWTTQKDFISTSLTGVRNQAEALENCQGMEWSLTEDEIEVIEQALLG